MKALFALTAFLWGSGCAVYNDQCQALVENPSERVAFIARGTELYLDRNNARHANNAMGQQAADAFAWIFQDSDKPVDFAIENGGAIRAEGLCVTRNIVREGPLSNGVLHEIMLFENTVSAVDLSEQEVLDLFEHSAERLFAKPNPIVTPAGSFLQVSKSVKVELDCSQPPLSRVLSITIGGRTVQKPARPLSEVKYRVAATNFLLGGGDGYAMLAGKLTDQARRPASAQRFGGIDSNITAEYLKQSEFNDSVEKGFKVDETRQSLLSCTVPTRPTN